MLNNLYRKLHILFASSVMLIITLVISFVVANTVHTEKINETLPEHGISLTNTSLHQN